MARIDQDLLASYMERFVGFGSYDAPFWFAGMEQGGGRNVAELATRLKAWDSLKRRDVLDLAEYCAQIKEKRWHGPRARIQPTLGKLIRVVLAVHGLEASAEAVKEYQRTDFGRVGKETLIAELLPLPSRSVGDWIYGDISDLPYLMTREAYRMELRPKRIELLGQLIARYEPRAVVMLGWTYRDEWNGLSRALLVERDLPHPGVRFAQRGKTQFVVSRHPTAFGVTNAYFGEIGRVLRSRQR